MAYFYVEIPVYPKHNEILATLIIGGLVLLMFILCKDCCRSEKKRDKKLEDLRKQLEKVKELVDELEEEKVVTRSQKKEDD